MKEDRVDAPVDALAPLYRGLLEVSEAIAAHRDLPQLFHELGQCLPRIVRFDFIGLVLHDPIREVMRVHTLQAVHSDKALPTLELPINESAGGLVWTTQQPLVVAQLSQETRFPKAAQFMLELGIQSFCMVPLTTAIRRLGAMGFGSLHQRGFEEPDLQFLQQVGRQVAVAVDNALNYQSAQ